MRSHPVYIIPNDMPRTQSMVKDSGGLWEDAGSHGVYVYVTDLPPFVVVADDPEFDSEPGTLADLMPPYTPTDTEVVRALQGPMGPTGPMGPQGVAA